MATLLSLRELVNREVPGATGNDIDFFMRRVARNFCSQTWYCRRSVELTLIAGQSTYDMVPDSVEEEVIGVKAVEWHQAPLNPARGVDLRSANGTPSTWFFKPPAELWAVPYPDANADLSEPWKVELAIQPIRACTEIPDDLVYEFDEALADGVISKILAMPGKPWTDPVESKQRGNMYMAKMLRAKAMVMGGFQPWNMRVAPRLFAVR